MGPFSAVRWVRATGFAVTCAALAVLGHLLGGGSFDPTAAVGGVLLLVPVALALTGRERTFGAILPATGLAQIVLHALLSHCEPYSATPHHHTPGMIHQGQMDHMATSALGMPLMHLASVVVTSAWLRWAEEGLCALARQLAGHVLRRLLVLLVLSPPEPYGQATVPATEKIRVPRARTLLRHALVRRGPPGARAASIAAF
ncbi:hypothetical protein ACFY19_19295 [Streptosporangium saharense]|uniref:hypothetical protein n=1 Tax=Streptosporangium saharense TaxID=1706840 RepID=UPI00368E5571